MNAISVIASCANITTSGTTARIAIPNAASGKAPFYVRLDCTQSAYVRLGDSSVNATTTDLLLSAGDSVVLKVCGATHIAAIQVASAGVVNVAPLED